MNGSCGEEDKSSKSDQPIDAQQEMMEVDENENGSLEIQEESNEIDCDDEDEWEDIEDEDGDDDDDEYGSDFDDYEVFYNDENEMKQSSITYYDMSNLNMLEIKENAFNGYQHIKELNLSENCIQTLQAGIFSTLSNLKRLDLSENFLSQLESACFVGLSQLTFLDLRENQIEHLDLSIFNDLQNLTICDLSINQLVSIRGENFLGLKNLSMLDLGDNSLTKIDLALFLSCPRLNELCLNNNQLTMGVDFTGGVSSYFTKEFIANCASQTQTGSAHINFSNLTRKFEKLSMTRLDNNPFRRIDCFTLLGLGNVEILSLQNEQGIEGDFSPFKTSISPNTFFYFTNLTDLFLSGIRFDKIKAGTFDGLHTLTYLSMAHCDLNHIEDGLFKDLVNLKKLNLSGNPLRTVSYKIFMGLKSLQGLSLANCELKKLPEFEGLVGRQLQRLYLHNNEIESISLNFFPHVPLIKVRTLYNDDDSKAQFKSFSIGSISHVDSYYFSEEGYLNFKKEKFVFDLKQFLDQFYE